MIKSAKPILALIGYGRMGREIEAAAAAQGFDIPTIIDHVQFSEQNLLSVDMLTGVDVCIDFTSPEAVLDNIGVCARAGKNVVVGTTGWESQYDVVARLVEEHGVGLIHAANYSVGVHVLSKIVSYAAELLRAYEQYDVAIHETHHTAKKDAPSGTALWLAHRILENLPRKSVISIERPVAPPGPHELLVSSTRVGSTPGEHEVVLDSSADTIALKHTARGRRGFAEGAILAASWIHGKTGIYSIEDMFDEIESL